MKHVVLFIVFLTFRTVTGQTSFFTRIPCVAAGEEGILIFVKVPSAARFDTNAPVAVYQVGGFQSSGIGSQDAGLVNEGFIEIEFNYPGNDDPSMQSGGIHDHRGLLSLRAACDVLRFAMGTLADEDGHHLSDLTAPIVPLSDNVGLIGYSNAGNTNICVAGLHGAELSTLAWILNWESPVGDGMPQAEAGAKQEGVLRPLNAEINPAYNPDTGMWTLDSLSYDENIQIPVLDMTDSTVVGCLYFDFNSDDIVDPGEDFIPYPLVFDTDSGRYAYYSERLRRYAAIHSLLPATVPDHIPSLAETESFWAIRNGEFWIEAALMHIPDLMFMIACSEIDHVQRALDHPPVLLQYEAFRLAGARFVRLNPDRAYMEAILGTAAPTAVDNAAFTPFNHWTVRTAVEPGNYMDTLGKRTNVPAGACELADRTYWDDLSPQIDSPITSVKSSLTSSDKEIRLVCHPNPFNEETIIEYTLPAPSEIELSVFDILGRRVALLVEGIRMAGTHRIPWQASDRPSGLYILRLKVNDLYYRQKIHLVR